MVITLLVVQYNVLIILVNQGEIFNKFISESIQVAMMEKSNTTIIEKQLKSLERIGIVVEYECGDSHEILKMVS